MHVRMHTPVVSHQILQHALLKTQERRVRGHVDEVLEREFNALVLELWKSRATAAL